MHGRDSLGLFRLVPGLLAAFVALGAEAQVQVTIDESLGFAPDPVYIVTGQSVFWTGDGMGPNADGSYTISSTDIPPAFPALNSDSFSVATFNNVGNFQYEDNDSHVGTISVSTNIPPTVSITFPTNNSVFNTPATFNFTAVASDTDADGLSDIEFDINGGFYDDIPASADTVTNSTLVTNLTVGTYTLSAIAFDNAGASTTNSITVTVQVPPPIRLAPGIVSGNFQITATGLTAGKTNILQTTTNLTSGTNWVALVTNIPGGTTQSFTNPIGSGRHYFRLVQLP